MGKSYRPERIGEEIRKIISDMMRRELKDPRIDGLVSITGVDVKDDYSYATVYISVMMTTADSQDEEKAKQKNESVIEGFNHAKGLLRRTIGRELKIHHTPELIFKIDSSIEYGKRIDKLIEELK